MVKALVGAAWKEAVKEDPTRSYYRAVLDLGILGLLACRIVANAKRKKEGSPHWIVFHSPPAGGDDLRIGALWDHKNEKTGAEYLLGRIRPRAFGLAELRGGAKVDFRLTDGEISVRLSEMKERSNENAPTHQLWRLTPVSKSAVVVQPKTAEVMEEAGVADESDDEANSESEFD